MNQKNLIKNQLEKSEVFPMYIKNLLISQMDTLSSEQIDLLERILKEEEEEIKKI